MSVKLLQLLLKHKQVQGSTGVIVLGQEQLAFYPTGQTRPSSLRPLIYNKTKST